MPRPFVAPMELAIWEVFRNTAVVAINERRERGPRRRGRRLPIELDGGRRQTGFRPGFPAYFLKTPAKNFDASAFASSFAFAS